MNSTMHRCFAFFMMNISDVSAYHHNNHMILLEKGNQSCYKKEDLFLRLFEVHLFDGYNSRRLNLHRRVN